MTQSHGRQADKNRLISLPYGLFNRHCRPVGLSMISTRTRDRARFGTVLFVVR